MEIVYPPVIALAHALFTVEGLRFTIRGSEHVPVDGGAVMAINHIGYMDFAYAGLAARPSKRVVRFMCKAEVFDHWAAGPLMRNMKQIPVDRDAGATSYRTAMKALQDGEIVGIFPEGTISQSFELSDFKEGAVRMAAAANVPVLPTIIWGSQRVWTKGKPRRLGRTNTPIHVYVGEPLQFTRKEAREKPDLLRERMLDLLRRAQEAYQDKPASDADSWWLPARLGGTAPIP